MTTSEHTMNQVRNILGRLDRSIDEARDRRLNGDDNAPEDAQAQDRATTEPDAQRPAGRVAGEAPPPPVGPRRDTSRAPSPFGRAKPLRRSGTDDA